MVVEWEEKETHLVATEHQSDLPLNSYKTSAILQPLGVPKPRQQRTITVHLQLIREYFDLYHEPCVSTLDMSRAWKWKCNHLDN